MKRGLTHLLSDLLSAILFFAIYLVSGNIVAAAAIAIAVGLAQFGAMKIAGREIGFLNVESNRENAFGGDERVLLERVAGLLAKFLTGPGKYLVRKAGEPEPKPRAAAA